MEPIFQGLSLLKIFYKIYLEKISAQDFHGHGKPNGKWHFPGLKSPEICKITDFLFFYPDVAYALPARVVSPTTLQLRQQQEPSWQAPPV